MDKEYEEIRVTLDKNGKECVKIFQGSLLSRTQINDDGFEVAYRLYETPRRKLACVVRKNPAWPSVSNFADEKWGDISQDPQWWQPQYHLHVVDDYEELEQQIGAELTKALRDNASPPEVEYLDI